MRRFRIRLLSAVPVIMLSLGTLSTLTSPALAYSPFDDFYNLLAEQFDELRGYVDTFISEEFEEDAPYVQAALNGTLGALGLPDMYDVEQSLEAYLDDLERGFGELDPENLLSDIGNNVDRQTVFAQAQSMLGEEGQQAQQEKLEQVAVLAETINTHAEVAYAAPSTQAAIKEMAQQNARQGDLLAGLEAELINSRMDSQLGNVISANISDTLDQDRRHRLNQQKATIITLQQLAVMSELY